MALGCDFFERIGEKRIDIRLRFLGYVCHIAKVRVCMSFGWVSIFAQKFFFLISLSVCTYRHKKLLQNLYVYLIRLCTRISLSGKRVCNSPSIRVSEISVYYENCRVVPTLGKHLFTLHFAKAWKFSIVAQQITRRHNRNSNESQIIMSRYSFSFRRKSRRNHPVICYFEKGVECANHIKTP